MSHLESSPMLEGEREKVNLGLILEENSGVGSGPMPEGAKLMLNSGPIPEVEESVQCQRVRKWC